MRKKLRWTTVLLLIMVAISATIWACTGFSLEGLFNETEKARYLFPEVCIFCSGYAWHAFACWLFRDEDSDALEDGNSSPDDSTN